MIIRAGAAHDPKGKHGLAMLTATLLDQGAGHRSAEQIAETIDFIGGVLGTGAGTDLSYVNAVVMKDSYDIALDLMADVVQRPTFAPEEIERQRQQALSALKVAAEDPESVADRVIDRLIYGFHPYGMPGAGTAESLAGLTRADFVDFHKKYFVPEQRADRRGRRHRRRRGDGRGSRSISAPGRPRGARARPSPSRPMRRGA